MYSTVYKYQYVIVLFQENTLGYKQLPSPMPEKEEMLMALPWLLEMAGNIEGSLWVLLYRQLIAACCQVSIQKSPIFSEQNMSPDFLVSYVKLYSSHLFPNATMPPEAILNIAAGALRLVHWQSWQMKLKPKP